MRIFRDLFVTVLLVIAIVAIFEIGMRLAGVRYDYSFFESDPVIYSAYRPNAEGWEVKEGENFVHINSYGMRDRERAITAAPGTTRIAMLGDSFVVGMQVPLEKTMAQLVERRLNDEFASTGQSFEVLNFAEGGAALSQSYAIMRERVWRFQPKVIMLFVSPASVTTCSRRLTTASSPVPYYVIRDGQILPDLQNRPPTDATPERRRQHAATANLMNQYRLLLLLRKATQDGLQREVAKMRDLTHRPATSDNGFNPMDAWFLPPSSPELEQAWDVAEGMLTLMIEDAHRHGAEFWLATIGTDIEDNANPAERAAFLKLHGYDGVNYAEDRFQNFAKQEGIPFIRMEPQLLEFAERNQLSLRGFFNTQPNRGHWNEHGNDAAAQIVTDSLIARSSVLQALSQLYETGPPASVNTASRTGRRKRLE